MPGLCCSGKTCVYWACFGNGSDTRRIVHCLNILEMGQTPASFNWIHAMFSFPYLFLHWLLFIYRLYKYRYLTTLASSRPTKSNLWVLIRGSPSTASRSSAWNVLMVSFLPFPLCITDVWVNIVDSFSRHLPWSQSLKKTQTKWTGSDRPFALNFRPMYAEDRVPC